MVDYSPHRAFHEKTFNVKEGIPSRPTVDLPRTPGLFGSHPELATTLPLPDIHNWRDDHNTNNNSSSSNSIEYYMSKALARFTRTSQLLMLGKLDAAGEDEEKKEAYEHNVLNQLLCLHTIYHISPASGDAKRKRQKTK
jgi:hypothetical protein